jgi:hypothetical protein
VIETKDEGDTVIHGGYRPCHSQMVADEEGQKIRVCPTWPEQFNVSA